MNWSIARILPGSRRATMSASALGALWQPTARLLTTNVGPGTGRAVGAGDGVAVMVGDGVAIGVAVAAGAVPAGVTVTSGRAAIGVAVGAVAGGALR
jgi:hypothetical protein